jgi:hypothetical protein
VFYSSVNHLEPTVNVLEPLPPRESVLNPILSILEAEIDFSCNINFVHEESIPVRNLFPGGINSSCGPEE